MSKKKLTLLKIKDTVPDIGKEPFSKIKKFQEM